MKPLLALTCLPTAALLLSLAACDRGRAPAAASRTGAIESGAVTVPMSPATVALSGAVADLPASTTPDANRIPAKPAAAAAATQRAVRPPPAVGGNLASALPVTPRETPAMRAFREAQARRDRELLDRDMAQSGRSGRDEPPPDPPWTRDQAPEADDLSAIDTDSADEAPPGDDDLPPEDDDAVDDAALGDEEPPPDDDDLRWDPATGTWR